MHVCVIINSQQAEKSCKRSIRSGHSCSWSRTTFSSVCSSVLFSVLLFSLASSSPCRLYRPFSTHFSSPVLSAYWWEILAGAREISEMKGAVKNAINSKLIFEIKADRGRPPCRRVPGDFSLSSYEVRATTSKRCGTPPLVLSFPLSHVLCFVLQRN